MKKKSVSLAASKVEIDNIPYHHNSQVRLAEPLRPVPKLLSEVVPRSSVTNSHLSKLMLVCPETAEAERRAAKTAAKEERLTIAMLNINWLSCYEIEIISDRCCENRQRCVVDLIILVIMCF